jgi:DNA-directed RNA polymerase subunit RPC12/RpoP
MDITFNCPTCQQELEVDASAAGSTIECPACSTSITVPIPEGVEEAAAAEAPAAPEPAPPPPVHAEKHFSVPVHDHAPAEPLIKKPNRPLEIAAKDSDKTMRVKTFKRSDCQEVGRDHFDETVSNFLEKVGQANIVNVNPITYSSLDLNTRTILVDYGVMIVYRG